MFTNQSWPGRRSESEGHSRRRRANRAAGKHRQFIGALEGQAGRRQNGNQSLGVGACLLTRRCTCRLRICHGPCIRNGRARYWSQVSLTLGNVLDQIRIFVFVILIGSASFVIAEEEILVACYRIDWQKYPAVYVDAPSNLVADMKLGLTNAISEEPELCDEDSEISWVCNGMEHRFFRGISGDGTELRSGYACSIEDEIPFLKYYPQTLVATSPCASIDWDEGENRYIVSEADDA